VQQCWQIESNRMNLAQLRLGLLDPSLVLKRGYAWLEQENGQTITSVEHIRSGQRVNATLADGVVNMTVL
jgi:exodeoxyribonuclease VII large subunit